MTVNRTGNKWEDVTSFPLMVGKVMKSVVSSADDLVFLSDDGYKFQFFHEQDCCETVVIHDIAGDLSDLVGEPILMAEEVSSEQQRDLGYYEESLTWTFYKFATSKGYVTVSFKGESNGYYSERVDYTEELVDVPSP